jgi:hypothetical protein
VFAEPLLGQPERPWVAGEVSPQPVSRIDRLDATAVLEGFWRAYVNGAHHFLEPAGDDPREMTGNIQASRNSLSLRPLEPFGSAWPGLARAGDSGPDADEFADPRCARQR